MAEQNFANHRKLFPLFHFFVLPVMMIGFVYAAYGWVKIGFEPRVGVAVLYMFALLVGFISARTMVLKVQDRVIRLEERLRYARVLPADLQPRIEEFTVCQLAALRCASDAELPGLARKVLDEKMNERKAIKQMVKNWRPDYLRA